MKKILLILTFLCGISTAWAQFEDEKENMNIFTRDSHLGVAKRWEYTIMAGFNSSSLVGNAAGEESVSAEIELGYNFSDHVFAGISSGVFHDFGSYHNYPKTVKKYVAACDYMPMLLVARYRWNAYNKVAFYAEGRVGLLSSTTPDPKDANDEIAWEYPSFFYYDIQPGVIMRMTRRFELRVSAGYGFAKPTGESKDYAKKEGLVTIKAGFAYRFSK